MDLYGIGLWAGRAQIQFKYRNSADANSAWQNSLSVTNRSSFPDRGERLRPFSEEESVVNQPKGEIDPVVGGLGLLQNPPRESVALFNHKRVVHHVQSLSRSVR